MLTLIYFLIRWYTCLTLIHPHVDGCLTLIMPYSDMSYVDIFTWIYASRIWMSYVDMSSVDIFPTLMCWVDTCHYRDPVDLSFIKFYVCLFFSEKPWC